MNCGLAGWPLNGKTISSSVTAVCPSPMQITNHFPSCFSLPEVYVRDNDNIWWLVCYVCKFRVSCLTVMVRFVYTCASTVSWLYFSEIWKWFLIKGVVRAVQYFCQKEPAKCNLWPVCIVCVATQTQSNLKAYFSDVYRIEFKVVFMF